MALLYVSLAWLAGIYLASQLNPTGPVIIFCLFLVAVATFIFRHSPGVPLAGLCLIVLFGGMLRLTIAQPTFDENSLAFYNDSGIVTISGRIADPPDERDRITYLRLEIDQIEHREESRQISGLAQITVPRFPQYSPGDRLQLTGRLQTPPRFEDFNYRDYLARKNIFSVLSYPKIELLEGQGLTIWDMPKLWLYDIRSGLAEGLSRSLPEPQASLAQGILLGLRRGLPDQLKDAFSRTGTTHIIAISGHNLSLIAGFIIVISAWAFGRRRPWYFVLSLLAIWLYAVLTGAAPPVVRAAVMASLVLWAGYLGRQATASVALSFAAAVMVGFEPNLLWDIGFQLSVFAMAGLLVATSYYPKGWRGALAATAGASLATLPIIAINFHHIPLVALPATLMALPALGPIIATSALTAVIGSIFPPLAFVASWTAWLSLSYLINVVEVWSMLPLASLDVGSIPELWAWAYYGVLLGGLAILHRRRRGLFRATSTGVPATRASLLTRVTTPALVLSLGGAALLLMGLALSPQPPLLKVSFLDVGQGDSILVEVKGQQRVLIDGGPSPKAVTGALDSMFPMWDRHLDMVILTHPEADHLTGLIEVIRRYPVSQVIESGLTSSSPVYEEWQIRLEEKGITPREVRRGERIVLGGGVYMDVLHPGQFLEGTESDSNNNSLVIRLVAGEIAFLLSGDIQNEGESAIMRAGLPLVSTVLKVPHHGSATSLSASFLDRINPQLAVISLGRENSFGHPHPQTMSRLESTTVLRTDENGTIQLTTDGYNLKMTKERAVPFAPALP